MMFRALQLKVTQISAVTTWKEGRKEGREEGRKEGMNEGRKEGRKDDLYQFIELDCPMQEHCSCYCAQNKQPVL